MQVGTKQIINLTNDSEKRALLESTKRDSSRLPKGDASTVLFSKAVGIWSLIRLSTKANQNAALTADVVSDSVI